MPGVVVIGCDRSVTGADAEALGARLAAWLGASVRSVYARGDAPWPGASPARMLHETAEDSGAAAIVVGSSHRAEPGRVRAGSVALRLLSGAPCPVAVAPRGYAAAALAGPPRIAAAYRPGPEGEAAVALAHQLAAGADSSLELVGVFDPEIDLTSPKAALYGMPGVIDELREHVRTDLQTAARGLGGVDGVTTTLLEGVPADELARVSARLDLLVVGSRGYGPLRAVLLGGVTRRLVRHARCPVLVVPRPTDTPAGVAAAGVTAATIA